LDKKGACRPPELRAAAVVPIRATCLFHMEETAHGLSSACSMPGDAGGPGTISHGYNCIHRECAPCPATPEAPALAAR